MTISEDIYYMNIALNMAKTNLGNTFPNPSVGAITVKDRKIISCGATSLGGRPHAEQNALKKAGLNAKGSTLYVSLEPCCYENKSPACTELIISSKVKRVVIAIKDPNPKVSGMGIEQLKKAGISVSYGICEKEAYDLNIGFFYTYEKKRPFIALKIASSLDSKIATLSGESKWITNNLARNYGHLIRANYDGILSGINTIIEDDPILNCRSLGLEKYSPVRIVLDSALRIQPSSNLIKTASKEHPVWIINNITDSDKELGKDGVLLIKSNSPKGAMVDLKFVVKRLMEQGITRLLIEGGSKIATSFLKLGLIDQIYWFKAPIVLGGDGKSAIEHLAISSLDNGIRLNLKKHIILGDNSLDIYTIKQLC